MYFAPVIRAQVIAKLHAALADGGWLVVGPAEGGPEVEHLFERHAEQGCTLYLKRPHRRVAPELPKRGPPRAVAAAAPPPAKPDEESRLRTLLDQGRFDEAAAAARQWAEAQPLDAAAHYHLGLAVEPATPALAAVAFRRAVYLDPQLSLAHFHLLRLEPEEAGRHLKALDASLAGCRDDEAVPLGDGVTAGDLVAVARQLAREKPA
jgi:chemotaxis protein methyltransferase CheR